MGKMQSVLVMIIAIVVMLLMFPLLLSGVHTTQTTKVTETTAGIVTTSGTSATLTLTTSAWQHRASVITIGSAGAGDTPAVSAVSVDGRTVTVTGLATSLTRVLTASYDVDALTDYTGMSTFVALIPFLVMIAAIGVLVFGAVNAFRG